MNHNFKKINELIKTSKNEAYQYFLSRCLSNASDIEIDYIVRSGINPRE